MSEGFSPILSAKATVAAQLLPPATIEFSHSGLSMPTRKANQARLLLSLAVVAEPRLMFLQTVCEKTFSHLNIHLKAIIKQQSKTILVMFSTPSTGQIWVPILQTTFSRPSARSPNRMLELTQPIAHRCSHTNWILSCVLQCQLDDAKKLRRPLPMDI